jgi:MoaA/NifB/PqqE/SkfB family radical SAM enzyme
MFPMQELAALGPGKLKVLMDISNKCNLRCRMCHFSFDRVFYRPADYLSPDGFRRIAAEVFPFAHTVVLSAGSEPTTSPHFEEILRIASEWPLRELKFLTNGTLLTESMTATLLDSRVSQIDVSIDGARAATYEHIRRGGRFDKLVRNLKRLRDLKRARGLPNPRVQFNVTLMKSNLRELDQFVDLAEECGVERIGCRHLMPYAGLDMAHESLFDVQPEANEAFRRFISRIERSNSVRLITFPDFFAETGAVPDCPRANPRAELEGRLNSGALRFSGSVAELPFGYVDLPEIQSEVVAETVHLAGWVLDADAVDCVVLASREADRPDTWRVHQVAKRVNGSRPDVAQRFAAYPDSSCAGWVCDLAAADLPAKGVRGATVEIVAVNRRGFASVLGSRRLRAPSALERLLRDKQTPFLFCQKPFNSIYIDCNGDVYPYPDCRPERASGNLLQDNASFPRIWHGAEQQKLRAAIVHGRPPAMCKTCPNFINRRPDEGAFFEERRVEEGYAVIARLPKPTRVRRG